MGNSAITSVKWSAFSGGMTTLLYFVQIVFLAKYLSPSDFGEMAIIMLVVEVANTYSDLGINPAIIYDKKIDNVTLSTFFWTNVIIGILFALLIIILSPVITILFSDSGIKKIIPFSALMLVILNTTQEFQFILQKSILFDKISLAETAGALFGSISSIIIVIIWHNVMAMILGQIINYFIKGILIAYYGAQIWKPSLVFSAQSLRKYVSLGFYQLMERTSYFINYRSDQFIIGNIFGTYWLGIYNFTFKLTVQPINRINPIISRVAFPFYVKILDNIEKLKENYLISVKIISFINIPILLGLYFFSEIVVIRIFGTQWSSAINILKIFCIISILRSINNLSTSLLLAHGNIRKSMIMSNIYTLFFTLSIVIAYMSKNIDYFLYTILCSQILFYYINYRLVIKMYLGSCFKQYIMGSFPFVIITIICVYILKFICNVKIDTQKSVLIALFVFGIISYLVLSAIIFYREVAIIRRKKLFDY